MSFSLASIFGGFGGGSTPPQQPSPGNTNQGQPPSPGTDVNGVTPPQQAPTPPVNQTPPATQTPLDTFADVWKTPENSATPQTPDSFFANVDPTKVFEAAKKVNFAQGVSAEHLQRITAGGEGAVQAFAEAMNAVAQNVYGQSTIAATKMIEQALKKNTEHQATQLPSMIKKLTANEQLATANPMLQNPAVQPLVGALTEQLTRRNPNATSGEIQQQVSDYFAALGSSFAPKPETPKSQSGSSRADTDWEAFLR